MASPEYKYDVAFSFLDQDLSIAMQLNDLLKDRIRTFLYSEKQKEIAGTDGEKTFNAVFGSEARLVVVLYRKGWGETPWTRIEETAIRGRAYDEGYDFVTFIPLDEKPIIPIWLPRTRLWIGLNRGGVNGAVSVIEARIQERGGELHEETVVEKAARIDRTMRFEEKRKKFLDSESGVIAAKQEYNCLKGELTQLIVEVKKSLNSVNIETREREVVVLGLRPTLHFLLEIAYRNSLHDSQLKISLYHGNPFVSPIVSFENPQELKSMLFTFDLLPSDNYCWTSAGLAKRQFSSKDLASFAMKYWMDAADNQRTSR